MVVSRDLLAEATRGRDRNAPALLSEAGLWTVGELGGAVDACADELLRSGVRRGALHPIVVEPDREGIVSMLAHWRVGAVPVPLNPRLTPTERARAVGELERLGEARGFHSGDPGDQGDQGEGDQGELPDGSQVVLWTSGTSGRPRGVVLSFENLRASSAAAAARLSLDGSEGWLASLSLAHVGGLALLTRALFTGALLVAPGRIGAEGVSEILDGGGMMRGSPTPITHLSLVPTQLLRLLDLRPGGAPAPTLVCALVGGAAIGTDLLARVLAAGWPIALTYGMTEMTSQVATAPPGRVRAKPGCVGTPLDGVSVRIGEDGEIQARGATLALGSVGGGASPLVDGEGWYRTGDLGRLDEEGDLWILGRSSDRIVSGGYTVDPFEVETVLSAWPGVADACVVGIPDPEWGEVVAAAVVPAFRPTPPGHAEAGDPASAAGEGIDLAALEHDLRTRVSGMKRPRLWRVVPELPRNPNGKVDRAAVRRLFGATSEPVVSSGPATP